MLKLDKRLLQKLFERYQKRKIEGKELDWDATLATLLSTCERFLAACKETGSKRYTEEGLIERLAAKSANSVNYSKNDLEKMCSSLNQIASKDDQIFFDYTGYYISALISKINAEGEVFNLDFSNSVSCLNSIGVGLYKVNLNVNGYIGDKFLMEAKNCKAHLIGEANEHPFLRIKNCEVRVDGELFGWIGELAENSKIEIYGDVPESQFSMRMRNTKCYINGKLIKVPTGLS